MSFCYPGGDDHYRCLSMTYSGVRCRKLRGSNVMYCNQHKNSPIKDTSNLSVFIDPDLFSIQYPTFDVNEQIVKQIQVEKKPYIQVPFVKNKLYSIVMIDPDHSDQSHRSVGNLILSGFSSLGNNVNNNLNNNVNRSKEYLHWLILNLSETDDDPDTNTVIPYEAPNLVNQNSRGLHRYIFYLLKHSQKVDSIFKNFSDRNNFSLQEFISKYGMSVIVVNYFTILASHS